MKLLFQTNITSLRNVRNSLSMSQTMTNKQVILGHENTEKLKEAIRMIEEADKILQSIS